MRFAQLAALAALIVTTSACASKLKRQLTDNTPESRSVEEALDTSQINFTDFASGATVNLKAYMEASDRDYLLLTFGSKGCTACNEKAALLTKDVIGKHSLFLTDPGKRFEIVGVNTDSEPAKRLAGYLGKFPYIRWSDPAGLGMIGHFVPPGRKFGVPVTVMVSRTGIAWRIMPEESTSIEILIEKVEITLQLRGGEAAGTGEGGDDGGAADGPAVDGSGDASDASDASDGTGAEDAGTTDADDGTDGATTDGGSTDATGDGGATDAVDGSDDGDGVVPTDLASMTPGRLKRVTVKGCDGVEQNLAAALGSADYRFVSVVRGACGPACEAQMRALKYVKERCARLSCAVATLFTDGIAPQICATSDRVPVYEGGASFFSVFKTHFDWSYTPIEHADFSLEMPPVEGPLLLGFARDGTLVHSIEGMVDEAALAELVEGPAIGEVARGPDFRLFDKARGEFGFADLRRQAKYTVVSAWSAFPLCQPCIEELVYWSQPGKLVDFCAARPGECQLAALELHEPAADQSLESYFDDVLTGRLPEFDGMNARGVRIPLLLDPKPVSGPLGNGYLFRFFDGYMSAAFPEMGYDPRTLIYDREGKIVGAFRSETPTEAHDPVFELLESLVD